jgi:hypothetical protein
MKLAHFIPDWTAKADACLLRFNSTRDMVVTGRDAWTVAHKAGIYREALDSGRDVVDAHVQSALQVIFPNAVFKDKKRY